MNEHELYFNDRGETELCFCPEADAYVHVEIRETASSFDVICSECSNVLQTLPKELRDYL